MAFKLDPGTFRMQSALFDTDRHAFGSGGRKSLKAAIILSLPLVPSRISTMLELKCASFIYS